MVQRSGNLPDILYVLILVAPRMGLVVPLCATPFGALLLFLVFLFVLLYYFDVGFEDDRQDVSGGTIDHFTVVAQ